MVIGMVVVDRVIPENNNYVNPVIVNSVTSTK